MTTRCPECDGRGIQGPHFPSIGERAEDFICKRCDDSGYVTPVWEPPRKINDAKEQNPGRRAEGAQGL